VDTDTFGGLLTGSSSTVLGDDGDEIPADRLFDDGRRVAGWLGGLGVRHGDRVAIRMPNTIDYVRVLAGCATGGFVAVSVNTRFTDAEADDLTARSGAVRRVEELGDAWRAVAPIAPRGRPDDAFVVFTTSGTTSRPKMVLHTQRSIASHARDVASGFGYGPGDVVMVAMPLCGTFGLASVTGAVAGDSRVVLTDYQLERTADLIADRRVTCLNGSDDMFHRLLQAGADLTSIRLGGYARFNTSLDGIVERADAAGATLTGLYGMSEVQALFSLRSPDGDAASRSRAGGTLVSPRADYRVVDGELQLRGPSLFAGYLREGGGEIDGDLTRRHHDDGWFRTGDAATADDERTFEYSARLGDVLRLGGFLVAPSEIEAALQELPGVEAVQVVAVDRPGGARPVAFVLGDPVDEQSAIAHCAARLARYKVPVRVVGLDEFPTTPSANGTKIQRVRLRDMAAELLDG
jgi:fatty-acyl-CoA synthase